MLCFLTAGLLAQGQYDLDSLSPFPEHVQYTHYSDQIGKGLAPRPALPTPGHIITAWLPGVHAAAGDQVGKGGGSHRGWSRV